MLKMLITELITITIIIEYESIIKIIEAVIRRD